MKVLSLMIQLLYMQELWFKPFATIQFHVDSVCLDNPVYACSHFKSQVVLIMYNYVLYLSKAAYQSNQAAFMYHFVNTEFMRQFILRFIFCTKFIYNEHKCSTNAIIN